MLATIICFLLIGGMDLLAQQPVAAPGPNGNFVFFGRNIPVGFQYKLERKPATSDTEWKEIYRTNAFTLNYQSVVDRLLQAGSKSPVFEMPDSSTISRFISLLKGKRTSDSVYIFNGLPAYIETMGTGFYDIQASPNTVYEYRISEIEKDQKIIKSAITKAEAFPGKVNFEKPLLKEHAPTSKSIVLRFALNGEKTPSSVRVFRQATLQTPFRESFPFKMYSRGKDGMEVTLIDSLVMPGVSYRYFIFPVDILGNTGAPSDTITINYGQGAIAPLEKFEAKSDSQFIVLNWRATMQKNMRGISIYRSENFDDGFTLLDRVPATDTTYTDRQIAKGISYFYYLVFHGLTETSLPSSKVIGMVDEKDKPILAPGYLKVSKIPEGNLIEWKRTEGNTRGYYVYRGEGYTSAQQQISGLVISDSINVTYIDSISNLRSGQTYCYAVSSVNRGNLESPKSEVLFSTRITPDLPTPMNLRVEMYNDKARLFWDDYSTVSNYITGYRVFRSEGTGGKRDTLAMVTMNSYYDSTVVRGVLYSYSVQSTGIQNAESPCSASASFILHEILPVPPAGLRVTPTDQNVIISWSLPATDNLTGFKIYREKLGGEKKLIASVGTEATNYTDQITEKGTYFYTVTSVTKSKESASCDEIGITIE